METISTYDQQSIDFLNLTNTEFKAEFIKNDLYFQDDKDTRDIYKITLKRGNRKYSFKFGQSTSNSSKYVLKTDKNEEFTLNGGNLKGRLKALSIDYLNTYCTLVKGKAPNAYDILACLEKYEHESFEDFCSNYGYDTDSRSAKKIYKACAKQFDKLSTLYSEDEMELLREIN